MMRRNSSSLTADGFTLVIVLWGLGIMTLFAIAIMSATRGRIEITANVVEATKAELLSEAGLELWRAKQGGDKLFFQTQAANQPRAVFCAMPGDALAAIAVDDEGGKIDLNSASPDLLARLIQGVGRSEAEAFAAADAISTFARPRSKDEAIRAATAYKEAGRDFAPKHTPFETVFELDQVLGVSQSLFQLLLPFVTVHNRQPGFDPRVAPLGLMTRLNVPSDRAAAAAIPSLPSEYLMPSPQRIYLIHSEVLTAGGGISAKQTIVEIGSGAGPARVLEHRRTASRFDTELKNGARAHPNRTLAGCQ